MRTLNRLSILPVLASFVFPFVAACTSSGPTIVANQDPGTDFSQYQTYSYMKPLATDKKGVQSLLSSYLIAATSRELDARGYRQVTADSDLEINFFVKTQDKIQASNQPKTSVGMGVGTFGRGISMGVSSGSKVSQKTEGTLTIDVVDRLRKQLVWEASSSGRVTDKVQNNLQEVVNAAITDMFQRYPVSPVNAAPTK